MFVQASSLNPSMLFDPAVPCRFQPTSAKVQTTGHFVCRDTLNLNVKALLHAIRELGSHAAVPTLEVHVQAFYDMCNIMVAGIPVNASKF